MISVQQWAKWMSKGNASLPHLLLENYKKLHLTDTEMMLIIHLHAFSNEGNHFPSIEQLLERMTCSKMELLHMLNRLRKERFIHIQSSLDAEGKLIESYSLEPLWEKLFRFLTIGLEDAALSGETDAAWPNAKDMDDLKGKEAEGEVFRRFEQEFGRPLSPVECETISHWFDEDRLTPGMIYMALKEAVISNKLSLRYIDKILFEWQKKGYRTVEEIQRHTQKFRQDQLAKSRAKQNNAAPVDFTFYNWLER